MAIKELISEHKTFIFIWILAIWAIIGILFGLQYMDGNYIEENNIQTKEQLILEYGVNEAMGDKLVVCVNGSYDVYRPNDLEKLSVCGNLLTPDVINYLQNLE